MSSAFWFPIAAVLEIAGCFTFWMWLRQGQSLWWVLPGLVALAGFAWVLTQVERRVGRDSDEIRQNDIKLLISF